MDKTSAGIVRYKIERGQLMILLLHPGGPFWSRKDLGAWSIPKGEYADGEDPVRVALRELEEETGLVIASEGLRELGSIKQKNRKVVTAWASEGGFDISMLRSNTFEIEWPPGSGAMRTFPEVDRAEWFPLKQAMERVTAGQDELLRRLEAALLEGRLIDARGEQDTPF